MDASLHVWLPEAHKTNHFKMQQKADVCVAPLKPQHRRYSSSAMLLARVEQSKCSYVYPHHH